MTIRVGAAAVQDVKLGAIQVAKVMLGTEQVWPAGTGAPPWRFVRVRNNTEPPGDGEFTQAYSGGRWLMWGFHDLDGIDVRPWIQQHAFDIPNVKVHLREGDGTLVGAYDLVDVQITGNAGNGTREAVRTSDYSPAAPAVGSVVVVDFPDLTGGSP